MEVIEYFTSREKTHWLAQIGECDWDAGRYLAQLLRENRLTEVVGENVLVLMLTQGSRLVSFCTLASMDDVQPTALTPWIGFVYTFPAFRGHGYAGLLLDSAESIATVMGREAVYISTNHKGFYERYGYDFFQTLSDLWGEPTRIYRKLLQTDGAEKEHRTEKGGLLKSAIVSKARQGIDPVAVCGFSCDHCFLGQWCGGCRSCFNCCSFGTMFEKGKCPNVACSQMKGIEGCYACGELSGCTVGFYAPDNDGAVACKAQALFVARHGKKRFLALQDRLHELYDFQKTQEILSQDLATACRILEETNALLPPESCAESMQEGKNE